MIGLDTNILVRYFAQDDARQAPPATRLVESLTRESPGFVSHVVLCELVWVLEEAYGAGKPEVLAILRGLLQAENLAIEHKPLAWAAFNEFSRGKLDFSVALILASGRAAGCEVIFTFDRAAARSNGSSLLSK